TPPPARCTVLLPSDPGQDLTDLIHSSGMDLIYQDGNTFTRRPASPEHTAALGSQGAGLGEGQDAVRVAAASFPATGTDRNRPLGRQPTTPHAAPAALPGRSPGSAAVHGQEPG
ncbi:hypothetical protein HER39_17695, partial [Arthrobacter deserti]|nr:hypothetical protein [Arthrobacter deserti]